MEWKKILNCSRLDDSSDESLGLSPFERDYYTIVTSSYFRRLQGKTQVYTLDESDFVRTRLTHSLEVAAIGEILGRKIAERIIDDSLCEDLPENFVSNVAAVAKCAGLLHDIGNPPFGHSGEYYIRAFFAENESKYRRNLPDSMWLDLTNFEGNAHNLRIATGLAISSNPNTRKYGMNLTYAVLNSIIKYPVSSLNNRQEGKKQYGKIGYYDSEKIIFKKITCGTGTWMNENCVLHNPIMLIMEAADDIAYKTADIEDSVKKGYVSTEDLISIFDKLSLDVEKFISNHSFSEVQDSFFESFIMHYKKKDLINPEEPKEEKEKIIQKLLKLIRESTIEYCAESFINNYELIMNGKFYNNEGNYYELINGAPFMTSELKNLIKTKGIFENRDRLAETKYKTKVSINLILEKILSTLSKSYNGDSLSLEEYILLDEMHQYIAKGEREVFYFTNWRGEDFQPQHWYHVCLAAVDFVSGMTDKYVGIFAEKYLYALSDRMDESKKEYKVRLISEIDYVENFSHADIVFSKLASVGNEWTNDERAIILNKIANNHNGVEISDDNRQMLNSVMYNVESRTILQDIFYAYEPDNKTNEQLSSEDYNRIRVTLLSFDNGF